MKAMILTISDRASLGESEDKSGPILVKILKANGWEIVSTQIMSDDQPEIENVLRKWADLGEVDVILTTGGTGFSTRDCTPEATMNVVDRIAPGIAEAMRSASLRITPHAMLSRAVAGIRGTTLIVNLPGSPRAAKENLLVALPALPHAVQLLSGDPDAETGHSIRTRKKHI